LLIGLQLNSFHHCSTGAVLVGAVLDEGAGSFGHYMGPFWTSFFLSYKLGAVLAKDRFGIDPSDQTQNTTLSELSRVTSGVAIGCAGCAMHTGPAPLGAQKFARHYAFK